MHFIMPVLSTQPTGPNVKRFLFISLLLISFTISAEHAYYIPRSSVVEVTIQKLSTPYLLSYHVVTVTNQTTLTL